MHMLNKALKVLMEYLELKCSWGEKVGNTSVNFVGRVYIR